MFTSVHRFALIGVVAALAALAGCKSSSSPPPACQLAPLGGDCTGPANCCSGNCQNLVCVEPAGACAQVAELCAAPSDCCLGACNGVECVDPAACTLVGLGCGDPTECCTGKCENGLCVEPVGQCAALGEACSGNGDCCGGLCGSGTPKLCEEPPPPSCMNPGDGACSADTQCCSGVCDGANGCTTAAFCEVAGSACASDSQCCSLSCAGGTCSSTLCRPSGTGPASQCADGSQCCSGICSVSGYCTAVPSSQAGSCKTLGESCALDGDCCSHTCRGDTCVPAYTCHATGDICYRTEDCCSGLCLGANGATPGRCDDASGDCGQDGLPCTSDSNCCTRKCVDLGTGTKVCQPSGGCRMNGNYCDSTDACCNINNLLPPTDPKRVECDPADHVCQNGGACNPPGDICGYKASQNCCFGKTDVCKPDANGIMRCFGGPPTHCDGTGCDAICPVGWDANDPQCCIPPGSGPESICQFRDQCCGFAPCVPDDAGVLHCAAVTTCKPPGAPCTGPGDASCCEGTTCVSDPEFGNVCMTAGGGCLQNGQGCALDGECCSGDCDTTASPAVCRTPCVVEGGACTVGADCCAGLACEIPPGGTSGTCTAGGSTCAATGQSCAVNADCCSPDDICLEGVCATTTTCSEIAQLCTAGGGECCAGLSCYALDASTNRVDCGSPQATGTCFCDAATCPVIGEQCSTLVPCCAGYCAQNGSLAACTSTDLAQCSCAPIG